MSLALFVFDKIIRLTMKRRLRRSPTPQTLREIMLATEARARPVPTGVAISSCDFGGVRVEKLARSGDDAARAILYIHGGGFVGGSPRTHRGITGRLAARLAPVYAVDYRLAPEHPFPAAIDDVQNAYRALVESGATSIAIGGDSAGGNLTLALMLAILEQKLSTPRALFVMSPATELAEVFPSRHSNASSDAMFVPGLFDAIRPAYMRDVDPKNPLISPLRGDLRGFPPTLLQCAEREMLRDDSVRFAAKLREAGVETKLDVWPGVFHAWPVAADVLPEGRRAIEDIIAFVQPRL